MKQSIKNELRMSEMHEVLEQLEREKVELATWMSETGGILFARALEIVQEDCDQLLPGYRGVEKLKVFRSLIRDAIKASIDGIVQGLEERDEQATIEEHRRMLR